MTTLSGKKGLVIGIANEHSARHFHAEGADLAITYLNTKAEPFASVTGNSAYVDVGHHVVA